MEIVPVLVYPLKSRIQSFDSDPYTPYITHRLSHLDENISGNCQNSIPLQLSDYAVKAIEKEEPYTEATLCCTLKIYYLNCQDFVEEQLYSNMSWGRF